MSEKISLDSSVISCNLVFNLFVRGFIRLFIDT